VNFLENTVAPIALAAIPGVGAFASAAYLGAKGGYDISNGNLLGGLGEIFGGVAGVGGSIGGVVGGAVQDGAQLANIGVNVDASVESGNPFGAIAAAAGATAPLGNFADTLGDDGLANAISDWAPEVVTAANIGANIATGNIAGAISIGANVAPGIADQLGASDGFVDAVGTWAPDVAKVGLGLAGGNYLAAAGLGLNLGSQIADQFDASDGVVNWLQSGSSETAIAAQVERAVASGNYALAASLASNAATDFGELLGSNGDAFNNLISQIAPYATSGVQLAQGIQGIVKDANQGNVSSTILSGAQVAFELPSIVQQIRTQLGGYGSDDIAL
jgi:hypothetical protein